MASERINPTDLTRLDYQDQLRLLRRSLLTSGPKAVKNEIRRHIQRIEESRSSLPKNPFSY